MLGDYLSAGVIDCAGDVESPLHIVAVEQKVLTVHIALGVLLVIVAITWPQCRAHVKFAISVRLTHDIARVVLANASDRPNDMRRVDVVIVIFVEGYVVGVQKFIRTIGFHIEGDVSIYAVDIVRHHGEIY